MDLITMNDNIKEFHADIQSYLTYKYLFKYFRK